MHAAQLQHISRPFQRIAQRLIRLVRARGPLHRDAFLRVASGRKTIGMDLCLHRSVGVIELFCIDGVGRREVEQIEVAVVERCPYGRMSRNKKR